MLFTEKNFRRLIYVIMAWLVVIAVVAGLPATFGQERPDGISINNKTGQVYDKDNNPIEWKPEWGVKPKLPAALIAALQHEPPPPPEPVEKQFTGTALYQGAIPSEFPAYSLAKFYIGDVTATIDVYTVYNGQVLVTEAIETKRKGEFVFTGPPGKYTIRITTYDPTKGFATVTANTVIKGGTGPITPDPVLPPPVEPDPPVDPGSPATGPPAEGQYGIGLIAYNWLVTNRPANTTGVKQLAAAYEWAATVKVEGNNTDLLNTELKARIDPIYAANPNLADLRKVMQTQATRLISKGLLKKFDEFQTAYKETALGFRAAYGK